MKALLRGVGGVIKIAFGIVGAIILLIIVIAAVAAAGKSKGSGTTSSPALVTPSTSSTTSSAPSPPQVFKGNGSENLGTINVSTPSTLHWSCSSCNVFGVDGSGGTVYIAVDSSNHTSGVTAVEPGTYHAVNVTANEIEGSTPTGWTVRITPGQ